jgi:asparagine synthase (glutamine-hydrolysing)
MCGIVAVMSRAGEVVAPPLLKRMTDSIAHRGPDGEGHFTTGPIGLGHRRLAIIDLSPAAHQPIANETGEVVLTFNGEIFNFQDLRIELESLGHGFHSQTDAEVVVHAWEEWGAASLLKFNGMFAFALWDGPKRQLWLTRDRFGVKPLYYFADDRWLVAASEIKAILLHPAVSRRVDPLALDEYFTFQNVLTDRTLFAGIRMLPPGHWVMAEPDRDGPPVPAQYWDYRFQEAAEPMDAGEAADLVYRAFTDAVTRQLVSDVPVGSYLSGGMDSGSVTAVARRHLGRLATFTCGFDLTSAQGLELAFDERAQAEVLANALKTEHYEVVLHAGDMEHVMPDLIWHLEDLRVGQCYPNFYVARLASKFVKVVLSGGGGDELFAGYPWRYYRGIHSKNREQFLHDYYDFWQRLVPDQDKPHAFTPEVLGEVRTRTAFEAFQGVFQSTSALDALDSRDSLVNVSLYFELKTFLHGLLVVEDKVSMAHGLETRVPFLDNELVDLAQRIPARLKLSDLDRPPIVVDEDDIGKRRARELRTSGGKMVLRDAMGRIIPPEVTARAKQGFSAPDASWFRGESIDYIEQIIGGRSAHLTEYITPAFIQRTLTEHRAARRNNRLLIWSLLSFEWWLRRFLS